MPGSLAWYDIGAAALGIYLLKRLLTRKLPAPLPPGPPGLPFIGNAVDMPTFEQWKTFTKWSEAYGDIVHLNVLGQSILILNSTSDAKALMDKRSAIYSDRPILVFGGQILGWNRTLVFAPYGERLRQMRKMAAKLMGSKVALAPYVSHIELESRRLLRRIHDNSEDLDDAIRRTAAAIILMISHGYQIQEHDDPIIAHVNIALDQFTATIQPGAFLVDFIPILRYIPAWFPGARFQRIVPSWRKTLVDMADIPHNFVKTQMAAGTNVPNFTSSHLEQNLSPEDEDVMKWAAASLYSGGADTTVSSNNVFYLAMTLYQGVQKKAQAEIDRVVGTDRLPLLSDRPDLPYIDAIQKEVLRWLPVGPIGVPHRLIKDDLYAGYFIPEGTIIMPNTWKMLHDPQTYSDPFEFKPERFLRETPEMDPTEVCFGFGRRVCPGKVLADASIWLACAMSLSVFDITVHVDPSTGKAVPPEPVMLSGTISHPKPFKCTIRPRSAKAEALITAIKYADES